MPELRTTPIKNRGHYFDGSTYWKVIAPAGQPDDVFYFDVRHTIVSWLKVSNVDNEPTIFSKSKNTSSGSDTNADNMLAFYITSESKLAYRLDNGATAINFTESTETLNLNSWDYVAVVSTYSQSNGDTTVDLIVNSLTYYT